VVPAVPAVQQVPAGGTASATAHRVEMIAHAAMVKVDRMRNVMIARVAMTVRAAMVKVDRM